MVNWYCEQVKNSSQYVLNNLPAPATGDCEKLGRGLGWLRNPGTPGPTLEGGITGIVVVPEIQSHQCTVTGLYI